MGVKSKRTAKVVTPAEDKPKRKYQESVEQGTIAHYIKKHHPNIIFETVEREGKRGAIKQNIIELLNSNTGWPDTRIYESRCGYHSLMIENKKANTDLFQKRNRLKFASEHYERQYRCHRLLIDRGHAVYFAAGVSEAIYILERYLDGNPIPFLTVNYEPYNPVDDSFLVERGL